MSYVVQLFVYDISGGMAKQFSRQLIGQQVDGIWHTGIVVYGKEFYFGGGISYDMPGQTPFGKPNSLKLSSPQVLPPSSYSQESQKFLKKCSWSSCVTFPLASKCQHTMCLPITATILLMSVQIFYLAKEFPKILLICQRCS